MFQLAIEPPDAPCAKAVQSAMRNNANYSIVIAAAKGWRARQCRQDIPGHSYDTILQLQACEAYLFSLRRLLPILFIPSNGTGWILSWAIGNVNLVLKFSFIKI
jgi:hypothetical protein